MFLTDEKPNYVKNYKIKLKKDEENNYFNGIIFCEPYIVNKVDLNLFEIFTTFPNIFKDTLSYRDRWWRMHFDFSLLQQENAIIMVMQTSIMNTET